MTKTKIKAVCIDDEQLALDTLCWQLSEFCPEVKVVAQFTRPREALSYLNSNDVDLCFLDIDMPELNGFQLLEEYGTPEFGVIFTTAYSEYAIKAFKVSALDYLLKPIDEEELVKTIARYSALQQPRSISEQLKLLTSQLQARGVEYPDRIALSTAEGIHMVAVDEVLRLQADNNYTTVYLRDGRKIIVSRTLKDVESLLDPRKFLRIHQSHCIQISGISMYQRAAGGTLVMSDGARLPVSRSKKESLLAHLGV